MSISTNKDLAYFSITNSVASVMRLIPIYFDQQVTYANVLTKSLDQKYLCFLTSQNISSHSFAFQSICGYFLQKLEEAYQNVVGLDDHLKNKISGFSRL